MKTRKSADVRRVEIADAAIDLLANGGTESLTIARLAERLQLSQAAIFRHFATKEHIWQAVFVQIEQRARAVWDAVEEHAADPVPSLAALVAAHIALIESTPAIPALVFSRDAHRANPTLCPPMARVMRQLSGRLEAKIARAQAAGALRRDVAPPDAALLLIGLVQGLVMRWSLGGRRFDLRREGARLVDVQLRCLAAPAAEAER